jgi:GT2 family glycosyltransferase
LSSPRVVILIVTWNQKEVTLACLRSLRSLDYDDYFILLIDNGSRDGTKEAVGREFPGVRIIETGANLGFIGGVNAGLKELPAEKPDYLLLLNNDTEAEPQFLRTLVSAAESHPEGGIFGPTIFYYDRPREVWFAGGRYRWYRGFGQHLTEISDSIREVDYITGCAMLVRAETLGRIGPMDERLFLYCDDVDWCLKARRSGYRVLYVPAAAVYHKVSSATEGLNSPYFLYYITRSSLCVAREHFGGIRWVLFLFSYLLYNRCKEIFVQSLRGNGRGAKAVFRGVCDFFRGRFGYTCVKQ